MWGHICTNDCDNTNYPVYHDMKGDYQKMCKCNGRNCQCSEQPLVLDKEFKLEVGKKYLTVSGAVAKCITVDLKRPKENYDTEWTCACAVTEKTGFDYVYFYRLDGIYGGGTKSSLLTIVGEYKESEYRYFPVYSQHGQYWTGGFRSKISDLGNYHSTHLVGLFKINIDTKEITKEDVTP